MFSDSAYKLYFIYGLAAIVTFCELKVANVLVLYCENGGWKNSETVKQVGADMNWDPFIYCFSPKMVYKYVLVNS